MRKYVLILTFFRIKNDVVKVHEIYHFIQRGLAGEFIKGAFFPLSTVFLEYSNLLRMMNQYILSKKSLFLSGLWFYFIIMMVIVVVVIVIIIVFRTEVLLLLILSMVMMMIKKLLSSLFSGPWFYYYFYQSASSPFLLTISQSLHSGEWGPPFITYFLHNHHHIIIFFSIFLLFLSLDDILLPRLICSYEA